MKILQLSTYDFDGGASRAAYRLHRGLLNADVYSRMLVSEKLSSDATVIGPRDRYDRGINMVRPHMDALPLSLYTRQVGTTWSLSWLPNGIEKKVGLLNPDLVHMHWTGFDFVPVKALARFYRPIIWTLHDMWPFTGGCHYAGDCTRYRETCGLCPQLGSNHRWDLSRWVMARKLKHWQKIGLTIVTPSKWLAGCARSSRLFADLRIEVIPNGLDLSIYKPVDKTLARKLLNLPLDRKLVLLGAINITGEPRKGFGFLQSAMAALAGSNSPTELELLIVGSGEPEKPTNLVYKAHYLGRWHDEISMALLYSAADLFVSPSIQDNLPNTIMEAMACGTPCVAFNIGGMSDMIVHGKNGYLAKPFDPLNLGEGIRWVLQDEQRLMALSLEARGMVEKEFSLDMIANRYKDLYEGVLSQGK